jgi:hypothetical protein
MFGGLAPLREINPDPCLLERSGNPDLSGNPGPLHLILTLGILAHFSSL